MKKVFIILIAISFYSPLLSQNLVSNPSFEDTLTCQVVDSFSLSPIQYYSLIGAVADWFDIGSADYFTSYNNYNASCFAFQCCVPQNVFGYQFPKTGNAYVGVGFNLYEFQSDTIYYVENIYSKLKSELIQGNKYCIEAFVSLSNYSQLTTSRIGIMFPTDSLFIDTVNNNPITVPQAISIYYSMYGAPVIENPLGNFITDTMGWTKLQGDFIAHGGERYILIGFLYPLNQFDTLHTNYSSFPGMNNSGYFYIDDVSVTDCTVGIEETMQQEEVLLSPSLAQEYVTIEYKPLAGNSCRLEVFSSMGSRVMEQTLPKGSNKHRLTVSQLPPGVYYVRLQWAKQTAVGRFVKQ